MLRNCIKAARCIHTSGKEVEIVVTLQESEKSYKVKAEVGKTLFSALVKAKLEDIDDKKFGCCGGKCKCGGCTVRFKSHLDKVPPLKEWQANLIMRAADLPKIEEYFIAIIRGNGRSLRLSCCTRVTEDLDKATIEIPLAYQKLI